ncbi:DUF3014 domain-containing protein [Candidatus Aminicenantes bacterium AC-334-K16]|jgi:hypothetical protein|nr:DUF3014 domain-containing protein [Candidatus Aminicenantes bacterium AC-334-K16]
MEESKKVFITGTVIIVLLVAALLIYFLVISPARKVEEEPLKVEEIKPTAEAERLGKEEPHPQALDVSLKESDQRLREMARSLSLHPQFARWLVTGDIIQKFVATVNNIAQGQSPRPHIDFFKLPEKFKVIKKKGHYYIDPSSYKRYDVIADVFASLDTEGCVRLYWLFQKPIQEAYTELGYPGQDFHPILLRAIEELLQVPVIEEEIEVVPRVTSYFFQKKELEKLSDAQKHLLRMGPSNVEIIKTKLQEFYEALKK